MPDFLHGEALVFFGALILFVNKKLLYEDNRIGWIYGAIGITCLTPYVLNEKLITLTLYHVFLLVLIAYGYYLTTTHSKGLSKLTQRNVKFGIIAFAFVACVVLTLRTFTDSKFSLLQLLQCTFGLGGSFFLAYEQSSRKKLGWIANGVSHIVAAWILFHLPNPIPAREVATFQILSMYYSYRGVKKHSKKITDSADVPT